MSNTVNLLTAAAKMMKALPTEFSSTQYKEAFRKVFPNSHRVSPGLECLNNNAYVRMVREEKFIAKIPYKEYRYADGFAISEKEWDDLSWGACNKLEKEHGRRSWNTYDRPDLPPTEVDRVRFIYSFNVELMRKDKQEMLDALMGAGI